MSIEFIHILILAIDCLFFLFYINCEKWYISMMMLRIAVIPILVLNIVNVVLWIKTLKKILSLFT
ncbi:hypothetical protein FACS1894133_2280 [Clostridia bacterium]|nr:hypothetical protein FACS1894133_2280 [Clostridia bacterium]